MSRPRVVCICGSMRFFAYMLDAARDESLGPDPTIVLMPFVNMRDSDPRWADPVDAERVKTSLGQVHRARIDQADEVLVVCPGEYIGDSTRWEIEYATHAGKPVRYRDTVYADQAVVPLPPPTSHDPDGTEARWDLPWAEFWVSDTAHVRSDMCAWFSDPRWFPSPNCPRIEELERELLAGLAAIAHHRAQGALRLWGGAR